MKTIVQTRATFILSVGFLLFVTAAAKLIGIIQNRPFLGHPDGVFPFLATREVLGISALLELTVATIMLMKKEEQIGLVACLWLVVVFVAYRVLAKLLFLQAPCHCLGGLLDWTYLPRRVIESIPIALLCYMGGGTVLYLVARNYSSKD